MRAKIREAIKKAMNATYRPDADFKIGYIQNINAGGFTLPCVWMCPLDLTKKDGRSEGTKTYAGTLYMLESIVNLSPEDKDDAWDRMENAALCGFNAAMNTDDDIICIDNIKCMPDEYALTGFNSISTKVTFDVICVYCASRE